MGVTHADGPAYSDPKLYESSSAIRQQADAQWVMSLLPVRSFRRCLDIACGNGNFLAELAASGRIEKELVGIDRSKEMVESARERLQELSRRFEVRIAVADALTFPEFRERFDLISLLAALHWMYPAEGEVLAWVRSQLGDRGVFCLTTYHPMLDEHSCGGSDILALEAMKRVGGPTLFPPDFLPIGRRTRSPEELDSMLRATFRTTDVLRKSAVTRVFSAEQYSQFHAATFGDYYAGLLHPELRSSYLRTIGEIAIERMNANDFVTSMDVRLWICRPDQKGT